jgi:hypothetical protein
MQNNTRLLGLVVVPGRVLWVAWEFATGVWGRIRITLHVRTGKENTLSNQNARD